ncbi:hypothetical protein H5410_004059 [Solanum commersonii]|uniref:Uncharacterized protein n=1 Tax=Solanum commersonii TaxID=4109 RepID=A0A9J6B6K1_SOLCO|nr:hypothetical protein H5410_004059 [Solanum commersonii]
MESYRGPVLSDLARRCNFKPKKASSEWGNVCHALAIPRGQTQRFGLRVVVKEGKVWWKKIIGARYVSDVCMARYRLIREFP